MGHQVEYLIDLPHARAQEWLSTIPGWWAEPEATGELPYGEFEWSDISLHADLCHAACHVVVPRIKYSWLVGDHAPSMEQVARLEGWLSDSLPGVRVIRLDELLRFDWESQSAREWWQWPDPVRALRDWLLSSGQDAAYFRLLPDERTHNEPSAPADRGSS